MIWSSNCFERESLTIKLSTFIASVALVTGTGSAYAEIDIGTLLGNAAVCAITEEALADMPVEPLYHSEQTTCEAANPAEVSASQWFSDADCTQALEFVETRMSDYCEASLDKASLGNAVDANPDAWTLTPGNRLDVGVKPLDGVAQPYLQRRVYKTITNERGTCELEMRVYAKHPDVANQRSMIAYHGGSWTSRGFGYFGLELTVPHFVEQGFVVFAPFYRLLSDRESTPACNQANFEDITEDAESALDWVLDHAAEYGASGLPVVFGQSAGGHLAASVSVERSETVSAAVLMYPPTDFSDFLLRVQQGFYTNEEGLSILERVLAAAANDVTIDSPLVYQNSFPIRVQDESLSLPPMMIVQGMKDELVESRQSVRLCQALAAEELLDTATEVDAIDAFVESRSCGEQSSLHLVREGNHALDVCIDERISSVCPAGGVGSRAAVAGVLEQAVAFSTTSVESTLPTASSGGGGGAFAGWLFAVFALMRAYVLTTSRSSIKESTL